MTIKLEQVIEAIEMSDDFFTSFWDTKTGETVYPADPLLNGETDEVLAAESEGLGSCILGWFDEKEIKSLTGIPSSKRVLLDILIGYPVKEKRKKMRKPKEKVISYNQY